MAAFTHEQASVTGLLRDALAALGYPVPQAKPGTPATLACLAAMAPSIGRFVASLDPETSRRVRLEQDPLRRAEMITKAAIARVQTKKAQRTVAAIGAVGQGFAAFRSAKKDTDRLKAVVGAVQKLTAALGR